MASACNRFANRASFSSIKSAIRSTPINRKPPSSSLPTSTPLNRFSLSRPPPQLGCVQSLLPFHSAVAAARLTACLSTNSRSCRALSQELGLSVPR